MALPVVHFIALVRIVGQSMASGAQSNQILFAVVGQAIPGFDVVDLQVPSPSQDWHRHPSQRKIFWYSS
jgi:hypothetical protein